MPRLANVTFLPPPNDAATWMAPLFRQPVESPVESPVFIGMPPLPRRSVAATQCLELGPAVFGRGRIGGIGQEALAHAKRLQPRGGDAAILDQPAAHFLGAQLGKGFVIAVRALGVGMADDAEQRHVRLPHGRAHLVQGRALVGRDAGRIEGEADGDIDLKLGRELAEDHGALACRGVRLGRLAAGGDGNHVQTARLLALDGGAIHFALSLEALQDLLLGQVLPLGGTGQKANTGQYG